MTWWWIPVNGIGAEFYLFFLLFVMSLCRQIAKIFMVRFFILSVYMFVLPVKMGQNAAGQMQPPLSNGPTPVPSLSQSCSFVLRPPCASQPLANGPHPASPQSHLVGNNHTPRPGTNGDVPYLHLNVLPHNCTSLGDAWESQHLRNTQVCVKHLLPYCS